MILQLNPPLPMETANGKGLAHFMIDYGVEEHLMWVIFMDADGTCWTVPNPEVRMQANWSLGRRPSSRPFPKAPPAPIIAPPGEAPAFPLVNGAAPAGGHAAMPPVNGHVNGVHLNGGATGGAAVSRYDAAPAE